MRLFHCACEGRQTLFFDDYACAPCQRPVGFCPDRLDMLCFEPDTGEGAAWAVAGAAKLHYKPCGNRGEADSPVCNWMIPEQDEQSFCAACRLNEIIPDLSIPDNRKLWARLEAAKRRALYSLLVLRLPLAPPQGSATQGLRFRFLADKDISTEFTEPLPDQPPVFTGHDSGEITVNVAEADEVARTRLRETLGEQYRTLLGHFRHELGHYYWDLLVAPDARRLKRFRALFGDERRNYEQARQAHYARPAGTLRGPGFVSDYATMHPWEDWAETWAHYLHMVDTLETANAFGLVIGGEAIPSWRLPQRRRFRRGTGIKDLTVRWLRLSVALNSLNRSMGLQDAYPFLLDDTIGRKLEWVHDTVTSSAEPSPS